MKIIRNDKDHHSSAAVKAPIIENIDSKENPTISLSIAVKNGRM